MKLNPIASNMTEVEIGENVVLFSYKTPVAARTPEGWFKTDCRCSATTTRHMNKCLNGAHVQQRPQSWFDGLTG